MNYKLMLRMLGRTLQVEALCLLVPLVVSLYYREDPLPFLYTILPVAILGTLLSRLKARAEFFSREGFTVVGLIWLAFCLFGALPFWFSGEFPSFADCFFESASGFTTTGGTALSDIESLPRGILFWRAFSSWIGGMGVLIFTMAFLPKVGGRSQTLFRAEVPGPVSTKLVPQTAHASQILYLMYFVLTGAELVALRIAGMPWFDAITTTFSCVCTAGFSVMNQSLGAYNLPACEIIAIVFMILGSLNFAVFFLVITGRARQALRSDELKFFLGILGVVSLLVFWNILPLYDTAGHALRDAVFQVTSLISTSGFSTVDYNLWPTFSQTLLLLLMFVGGCSGSTAGSIKCGRILLLLRSSTRSILRLSHPRAVKVVKLDGKPVNEETLGSVFSFFVCYFLLLGLGSVVVSLDGHSLISSFTAALGCLSNVGPGLDLVGPFGNFSSFSEFNKIFLGVLMLVGRLEIFPILLLFHPSTWRRT